MTLDEGIQRAKDRGDLQMVRWLSDLKYFSDFEDKTKPVPCWKFVKENSAERQLLKVFSELAEVLEALQEGDPDHTAEEATDGITALTTLLEILGYNEERRAVLQVRVNEKNRRRGYWNES